MTRWSANTRARGRRSALAYGSRSTTAAESTTSTGSYTTSGDATGRGWGGTLGNPMTPSGGHCGGGDRKRPLIRLFCAFRGRLVYPLASPVTPEVAGSSPVAPVSEVPAIWPHACGLTRGLLDKKDERFGQDAVVCHRVCGLLR